MTKILVVDDHPANRALIVTLVTHRGYQALEAGDGAEALALVAQERPALVVCDILMPTMDGYEFVRRLRADPLIAGTEVIFYSAYYREREARSLAESCGVSHVISKPCEPAEILRIIEAALAHEPRAVPQPVGLAFDHQHLRILTDELAGKVDELKISNDRLAALIDLNLRLASENDPKALLQQVCRGARDLLGARFAVLAATDKGNDSRVHAFTSGIDEKVAGQLAVPDLHHGLLGDVFADRAPRRFASADGSPGDLGLPRGYPPARAGLAAAVSSPTQTFGWIFLGDKLGRTAFDEDDERLLAILGAQVGRIYENGSLYHRLRQHTEQMKIEIAERERTGEALLGMIRRLEALRVLDNKILEAHMPVDVAGVALQHLAQLVPILGASVIMFDHVRERAVVLAKQAGPHARLELAGHMPLARYGLADYEALRRGLICDVPDMAAMAQRPPFLDALWAQGMRSYVRVPIMFEGVLAGALSMGSDQVGYFTAEQIDITRSIANQLGIALQQADLRQRIAEQAAELERRVVERTAQLEAANHDLEAFSYTVSHDLRSPLRAIDGFSRMLESGHAKQLDADGLRFLEAIRKNGERMAALIDDLLRFAQMGREHVSRAAVDMEALAREAWAEVAASPEVQLRMQGLPPALGDRALLKQVWLNLLSNAVKYSAKQVRPEIEVGAVELGGDIVYSVKDNGAGFDMRYYDKLFGVFQRLHSTKEFSGTGVGLAIVQRVISRHGGRVWAESDVGRGASFHFSLARPAVDHGEAGSRQ